MKRIGKGDYAWSTNRDDLPGHARLMTKEVKGYLKTEADQAPPHVRWHRQVGRQMRSRLPLHRRAGPDPDADRLPSGRRRQAALPPQRREPQQPRQPSRRSTTQLSRLPEPSTTGLSRPRLKTAMKSPERSPDDVNATQIRKTVAEIIDRLGIANSLRAVANDCRLHETDANQHPDPEMATAWRQAGLQIGHLAQELEPSLANQRASEPAKPEEMSNQANELVRTLGIAKAILAIANNCLRRAKDTDHPENTDLAVSWQNAALHTGRLSHALEGSIADHPASGNHGDNPVRRPEDETEPNGQGLHRPLRRRIHREPPGERRAPNRRRAPAHPHRRTAHRLTPASASPTDIRPRSQSLTGPGLPTLCTQPDRRLAGRRPVPHHFRRAATAAPQPFRPHTQPVSKSTTPTAERAHQQLPIPLGNHRELRGETYLHTGAATFPTPIEPFRPMPIRIRIIHAVPAHRTPPINPHHGH